MPSHTATSAAPKNRPPVLPITMYAMPNPRRTRKAGIAPITRIVRTAGGYSSHRTHTEYAASGGLLSGLVIADALRVAEHPEFRDVAAEEERHGPVGDDAQLPGQERQLVQVVGAGDEPAGEAAEPDAEHVGDAAVASERRHLAEHAVAVGLRAPAQVLREPPRLAERMLG